MWGAAPPRALSSTEPSGTPERWGLGDAAVGYVVGFVLANVATGLWVAVSSAEAGDRTFGLTVAGVAGLWTGFLGAVLLASRRKGSGSLAHDFGFRLGPGDLRIGLVAGPATQIVVVLLYLVLGLEAGEENEQLVESTRGLGLVVLYLVLAVGAPVVEELFFRGLLQRSLVRRYGPGPGIGVTAVLFGLTHFDLAVLPGITLFGVVLGVLAHRHGRLGPAIAAHVAFNAIAVAIYLG